MGVKRMRILPLILILLLLAGCGFDIEQISMPEIPSIDMGGSTLSGCVEYINGRTCRILITEGDSHFDAETEDDEADVVYVTYTDLEGSKSVLVGDNVSFEYDYATQVSEHLGIPHISVSRLRVE